MKVKATLTFSEEHVKRTMDAVKISTADELVAFLKGVYAAQIPTQLADVDIEVIEDNNE